MPAAATCAGPVRGLGPLVVRHLSGTVDQGFGFRARAEGFLHTYEVPIREQTSGQYLGLRYASQRQVLPESLLLVRAEQLSRPDETPAP